MSLQISSPTHIRLPSRVLGYGGGDPGQDSKESSSRWGQFSSYIDFRQGKDERIVSDEKSGK